jgi:hypothetical protein
LAEWAATAGGYNFDCIAFVKGITAALEEVPVESVES